ncbi:MAG: hypothetical protein RLZZ510_1204, partial [Bacteroidota bacterium]
MGDGNLLCPFKSIWVFDTFLCCTKNSENY